MGRPYLHTFAIISLTFHSIFYRLHLSKKRFNPQIALMCSPLSPALLFQDLLISSISVFRGTSPPHYVFNIPKTTPENKNWLSILQTPSIKSNIPLPPPPKSNHLTTNTPNQCDEKKPVCWNCQKQSLCCEYIVLTQIRQVLPIADTPNSNPGGGTPFWGVDHGVEDGDGGDLRLNLFHLELLHNYSTSTAFSVSNDPAICKLLSIFLIWLIGYELLFSLMYVWDK